ncbi:MAG: sensor histidine kinase, partial [Desulfomonilia bacterium]
LERIQALVEELKDVTNSIAHDIRSPLTRIRGVAETTLTGQPSPEEYQDMAVMVIDECDRLTEMINTMLEIAQTDSGIAQLSRTSLDLVELVRDAYELFSAVAEDKNLSFTFDPRDKKIEIFGDRSRLQRAIANIVDNALKYTPHDGSVNITVWQDLSHAVLTVSDSGSGITEQDLPHIFDRFFRSDSSRSTPGNGLGLSLSQSIIKAHEGEISVTSAPGVGSTFTVLLRK